MSFVKVKSIKKTTVKDTYDIEMTKNHNFLANGTVVHNSHSEAYSILSWVGAYYKANYPLEFYLGMLQTLGQVSGKVEGTDKDKIHMLLLDYKEHGYKLLYPDINKSKTTFTLDPIEDGKEYIRVGLDYIRGIGTKQAEEVVRNQPYESYQHFLSKVNRTKVNSKVVQILKDMGLFNSIGGAPDISEKFVPDIMLLESISEINTSFNLVLKDILSGTTETTNLDSLFSALDIELLDLVEAQDIITETEKTEMLETQGATWSQFDERLLKKAISKIKAKLRSLKGKITKKQLLFETLSEQQKYIDQIEFISEQLDTKFKLVDGVIRLYKKVPEKRPDVNSEEQKSPLLESITTISTYLNTSENTNITYCFNQLQETSLGEVVKTCGYTEDEVKNIMFAIYVGNTLKVDIDNLLEQLQQELKINTKNVTIEPNISMVMKTCPILLYVDLSDYRVCVPHLHKFVPLSTMDFTQEIKGGVTIGAFFDKVILNDTGILNKSRVKGNLMIKDKKMPVFINGTTYNRYKYLFDDLKNGDPVIVKFNISPGFNLMQISTILKADVFKSMLLKQTPWSEDYVAFFKPM